jgi:hypothetical protein
VELLSGGWRHSLEGGRIPSLRAHLEEERCTSSWRAHLVYERFHGGGRALCLRGDLSEKLRAHFHCLVLARGGAH